MRTPDWNEFGLFLLEDKNVLRKLRALGTEKCSRAVLKYLRSGIDFGAVARVSRSLLDDAVLPPTHLLTDGAWIWPSDIVFYVAEHDVAVPEEFKQHMAARNWKMPRLDATELHSAMFAAESMMGGEESFDPAMFDDPELRKLMEDWLQDE